MSKKKNEIELSAIFRRGFVRAELTHSTRVSAHAYTRAYTFRRIRVSRCVEYIGVKKREKGREELGYGGALALEGYRWQAAHGPHHDFRSRRWFLLRHTIMVFCQACREQAVGHVVFLDQFSPQN